MHTILEGRRPLMVTALALFALAALGGAVMAIQRFSGRDTPSPASPAIAALHGVLAAAGLVALLLAVLHGPAPSVAKVALGLFLLVALAGFGLVSYHFRRKPLPKGLLLGHGGFAVLAFLLLVFTYLRH